MLKEKFRFDFVSSQSQTPSGHIRGFEFVTLSHPLEANTVVGSFPSSSSIGHRHIDTPTQGASEKGVLEQQTQQ
nr:MAG TPA: hypothetical protein [Siphoviridae sp. ctX8T1]